MCLLDLFLVFINLDFLDIECRGLDRFDLRLGQLSFCPNLSRPIGFRLVSTNVQIGLDQSPFGRILFRLVWLLFGPRLDQSPFRRFRSRSVRLLFGLYRLSSEPVSSFTFLATTFRLFGLTLVLGRNRQSL